MNKKIIFISALAAIVIAIMIYTQMSDDRITDDVIPVAKFKLSAPSSYIIDGSNGSFSITRDGEPFPILLVSAGDIYLTIDEYKNDRIISGRLLLECAADSPRTSVACDKIISSSQENIRGWRKFSYILNKVSLTFSDGGSLRAESEYGPIVELFTAGQPIWTFRPFDFSGLEDVPRNAARQEIDLIVEMSLSN